GLRAEYLLDHQQVAGREPQQPAARPWWPVVPLVLVLVLVVVVVIVVVVLGPARAGPGVAQRRRGRPGRQAALHVAPGPEPDRGMRRVPGHLPGIERLEYLGAYPGGQVPQLVLGDDRRQVRLVARIQAAGVDRDETVVRGLQRQLPVGVY